MCRTRRRWPTAPIKGGQPISRELERANRGTIDEVARHLGIPIALATNAGDENIDFVLDGLEVRSSFQVVIGAEDVQLGKPDPEILHLAAARLDLPPDRCTVFEDSSPGIEAAQRAHQVHPQVPHLAAGLLVVGAEICQVQPVRREQDHQLQEALTPPAPAPAPAARR